MASRVVQRTEPRIRPASLNADGVEVVMGMRKSMSMRRINAVTFTFGFGCN